MRTWSHTNKCVCFIHMCVCFIHMCVCFIHMTRVRTLACGEPGTGKVCEI